jgi:hypothetical protein
MSSSFTCYICSNTFAQKKNLTRHLSDKTCKSKLLTDLSELNTLLKQKNMQDKKIQEIQQEIEIQEIQQEIEIPIIQPVTEQQLTFDGIFQGREHEIRITPDKMISVFDFIKVVGGQRNPKQTWSNIQNSHKDEVVQFLDYFKFPGQGQSKTPVINVQGMVKLLFWLPGEMAKQFRSKSAEIMIRYLGGDTTLIDEIKAIDQCHVENPNNVAQIFREEVNNSNNLINFDQMNNSKQLLSHFGSKTNVLYMLLFSLSEKWYLKFGIVNVRPFYERYNEHLSELGPDICVIDAFQSPDVSAIESEHKSTSFFKQYKTILPKKNGVGKHTEIYELTETLTYNMIKSEIVKTAGERIIDPPPSYSKAIENNVVDLELSKQLTKQKEIELEIKKLDVRQNEQIELTKQKQIEYEMKKLDFEMVKLKNA